MSQPISPDIYISININTTRYLALCSARWMNNRLTASVPDFGDGRRFQMAMMGVRSKFQESRSQASVACHQ